jgi:hypothetical protein
MPTRSAFTLSATRVQSVSARRSTAPVKGHRTTIRLLPVTDGNRTYFEWTSEFDSDPASEARLVPLMEQNFLAGARELRAQFAVGRWILRKDKEAPGEGPGTLDPKVLESFGPVQGPSKLAGPPGVGRLVCYKPRWRKIPRRSITFGIS